MCNSCSVYGGIIFPNFVGQSCCNPCCRSSGSSTTSTTAAVAGVSTTATNPSNGSTCGCEDYCTLDKVCIGTHEADPTVDQCTDCLSFVKK